MKRRFLQLGVFVLMCAFGSIAIHAQRPNPGAQTPQTPAKNLPSTGTGRGNQPSTEAKAEMQAARQQLDKDMAAAKQLEADLKADKKAGNKDKFTADQAEMKTLQETIKQDRAKIQQILKANGKGK